jgi:hypothetical protein
LPTAIGRRLTLTPEPDLTGGENQKIKYLYFLIWLTSDYNLAMKTKNIRSISRTRTGHHTPK